MPFRLGMFGGAFDPPHAAHLALARSALDQLGLDELRIVPTGQAWHKVRTLSDAAHRVAMAELAFGALPRTVVDARETLRSGATYTVDTLRELQREHPGADLFLVIGEDQSAAFTTWRDWEAIAAMATLAIAARPGAGASLSSLPPQVRAIRLELAAMPISATAIRARLTAGEDAGELVPAPVASYIDRHHLYRKSG